MYYNLLTKQNNKMKRIELLAKAAQELQKICEFEPAIKTKGKTEDELEASLREAGEALTPEDKLSKETQKVLKELKITIGEAPAETEEEEEIEEELEEETEEEELEDEEEEEEDKPEAPPVKKKVKEEKVVAKKEKEDAGEKKVALSSSEKLDFFEPLIKKGNLTMKQLINKALEEHPGVSESAIRTFLSDSKNPKYNKFPKLVEIDKEGVVKFKK